MTVAALANPHDIRHALLPRMADGLAAAVAASLPWSTSATGIAVALWLVATLPTLDAAALRRVLASAAGGLPVVLAVLAIVGASWADGPLAERLRGAVPFLRLLMIPILLAQFRRSENGAWVGAAFLASAAVLLAASFAMVALGIQRGPAIGVPVKDYASQSGIFLLCGFGLFELSIGLLRTGRRNAAAAGIALALLFFADIAYVSSSRTTLVVIPVLYVLWGFHRLAGKRLIGFLCAGLVAGAAVWIAAPAVDARLMQIPSEIETARTTAAVTSSGSRLGFWENALVALGEAPALGHGTGTIAESLSRPAVPGAGAGAPNPHNEIFAVGIQLGGVGIAVLIAMWAAHWWMFLRPGLVAWIGLAAVTQNIVGSLFNSHLMDFTQGWLYVFAVGVNGGMLLTKSGLAAPGEAPRPVRTADPQMPGTATPARSFSGDSPGLGS